MRETERDGGVEETEGERRRERKTEGWSLLHNDTLFFLCLYTPSRLVLHVRGGK